MNLIGEIDTCSNPSARACNHDATTLSDNSNEIKYNPESGKFMAHVVWHTISWYGTQGICTTQ